MNEQSQSVAHSFADRVRAFHQDLPIEEQRLLEQVFALATIAASDEHDTKGHGADFLLMIDGFQPKEGIGVLSALGLQSAGTKGFSWSESQTGSA
jgi:hypothetical protein